MTAVPDSPASPSLSSFIDELDVLIRARYPLIYLVTWEEQRVDALLASLAESHGKALFTWSVTQGLCRLDDGRTASKADGSTDPGAALAAVEKLAEPALVVFKDFHPYLNDAAVIRRMRELARTLKSTFTTMMLVSPVLNIPPELEKEISVLDVPLPGIEDLLKLLREIVSVVREGKRAVIDLRNEDVEPLLKAALGLTLFEAENAFAKAIAQDQRLDATDIQLVLAEKRQVIRKSGLLEYCSTNESFACIGGLQNLKAWLDQRTAAFTERARQFGLPAPKGLLLLGVQGCGKSLTAKAVASQWHLPLLRLDMGRIFSGLVGSSEENMRKAMRVAESIAPAVLWVDELEKGLAGIGSSGTTDSGVTARVFGSFLTWLQEKTAPVFVVATANRIDSLPAELLRKGRFDEIFFIDLPTAIERAQIFTIHLQRFGRNPDSFKVEELALRAEHFSGAEIEQVVVSGLYAAFAEGVELQQRHLVTALSETMPLAVTMREDIAHLREWARTRTRPASTSEPERPGRIGIV
jgi:ATP-dependent 26S proteasome regulatory subunit